MHSLLDAALGFAAVADKLHNLRSPVADYGEIGEPLSQRFKRGRAAMAWYYQAVIDSLKAGGLGDHPLLTEFESRAAQFFGAPAAAGGATVAGAVPARLEKISL